MMISSCMENPNIAGDGRGRSIKVVARCMRSWSEAERSTKLLHLSRNAQSFQSVVFKILECCWSSLLSGPSLEHSGALLTNSFLSSSCNPITDYEPP